MNIIIYNHNNNYYYITGSRQYLSQPRLALLCRRHHEPLDPPDGLPGGHHRHPDRNHHAEALPVGPRHSSGQTLPIQVGSTVIDLLQHQFPKQNQFVGLRLASKYTSLFYVSYILFI